MNKIYIVSSIALPDGFAGHCGASEVCRTDVSQLHRAGAEDVIISISDSYPGKYDAAMGKVCAENGCTGLKIYFSEEYIVFAFMTPGGVNCTDCWLEHLKDNGTEYVLCGRKDGYPPDNYYMHMLFTDMFLGPLINNRADVSGDSSIYVFSFRTRRLDRHKVIKHERCSIHSKPEYISSAGMLLTDRGEKLNDSYRVRSDIDTEQIKSDLCDSMSGIIRNIYKDMNSSIIPLVVCEMMTSGGRIINGSYGRSMSFSSSERSAILEMLERYSVMWPKNGTEIIRSSYEAIKDKAYDPEKLLLPYHRGRNSSFCEYSPSLEFDWVKAYRVTGGEEVLVPAQIAYYDLDEVRTDVRRFVYETSNGSALGGSLQEAVLYGMFEVIERDSFMNAWYNRLSLPAIDITTIKSERLKRLIAQAEKHYEMHFYNSTSDNGIPSVICIAFNRDSDSLVSTYMAAGCHIDAEAAVESALVEVISSIPVYERGFMSKQERADELLADPEKVSGMEDHVLLYSRHQLREQYRFLLDSEEKCSIEEMQHTTADICKSRDLHEILDYVYSALLKNCDDILVVDCTNDIIRKYGLYAVKVLIPGMQPMTFGNQNKRINMERLAKTAAVSGYRSGAGEGINLFPHPFP